MIIDFSKFLINLQKDYYNTNPLITIYDTLNLLTDLDIKIFENKYESKEYTELELKWAIIYKINPSIEITGLHFKHELISIYNYPIGTKVWYLTLLDTYKGKYHSIFGKTIEEVLSLSIQYCTGLLKFNSEFIESFQVEAKSEYYNQKEYTDIPNSEPYYDRYLNRSN